jgi:xanthine dehydrogenase accessory factor
MTLEIATSPRDAGDFTPSTALVKGGGELGTAVALALWRVGWQVVVGELPRPTVLRRQLSLAEAAFAGSVTREGVVARRVTAPPEAVALAQAPTKIPLYVGPLSAIVATLRPALVVDARMRRGVVPERQRREAPMVVGLGPELVAGEHVDFVIETCPGPDLGRVIAIGVARPHAALPRTPGSAAEEYVRAAHAGLWRTERAIGDIVAERELLGSLEGKPVHAPVAGCVRGLVHDHLAAPAGLKLAAVHPGDWRRKEAGIGNRAAVIAASVVALATDGTAPLILPSHGRAAVLTTVAT